MQVNELKTDNNAPESPDNVTERQLAYGLLRRNGLTVKKAAKLMGYNPKYVYNVEKKLGKYDLTDCKMVSQAHKVLKNIMRGKTWGEIENIKDSTALAAAESILDRAQPKVRQSLNVNLTADIHPVDLSRYVTLTDDYVTEVNDDQTVDITGSYGGEDK